MCEHQPNPASQEHAPRAILLAEDDPEMRTLLTRLLRRSGYVVEACADGGQLITHLVPLIESPGDVEYDVIISDIRMPLMSGLEVVEGLMRYDNCPPIILITAFGDAETHKRARELGVRRMLDKPFEIDALLVAVRDIVSPPHTTKDNLN